MGSRAEGVTMSSICTCGLLQARKAGTSVVDGYETCGRCGKPLEFRDQQVGTAAGLDSPQPVQISESPTSWVIGGAAILVASVLLAMVNSTNPTPGRGSAFLAVVTEFGYIAGSLVILVGVIAKGVALGIAVSRND